MHEKKEVQVKGKDECDFDSFGSMVCVFDEGGERTATHMASLQHQAIRFKFVFRLSKFEKM